MTGKDAEALKWHWNRHGQLGLATATSVQKAIELLLDVGKGILA